MSDKVFLPINKTEGEIFYMQTSTEITLHKNYEERNYLFVDVRENDDITWSGWVKSLECYKVSNYSTECAIHEKDFSNSMLSSFASSGDLMSDSVSSIIKNIAKDNNHEAKDFLGYIKNALEHYKKKKVSQEIEISEHDWNSSARSFIEFMRYVPAFYNKPKIKVYVDERTGFFGVIYKRTTCNSGTLNILVKDNYELEFSFAKKRNGIITITGLAKFGKSLGNSDQIRSIFKLME